MSDLDTKAILDKLDASAKEARTGRKEIYKEITDVKLHLKDINGQVGATRGDIDEHLEAHGRVRDAIYRIIIAVVTVATLAWVGLR